MNITTAMYLDAAHTAVLVNGNISVPVSDKNQEWREVLAWVARGNTIAEFLAPEFAEQLRSAIATVAPVKSVRIGDRNNKATWVIQYSGNITPQQRAAAEAIIDLYSYDPAQIPFVLLERAAIRQLILDAAAQPGAAKVYTDYAARAPLPID